jgi:hypothetical protein
MTITRMLEVLTTNKTKWENLTDEEQKLFNVFTVNMMVSTNPDYVELINYTQLHYTLPKKVVYNLYLRMFPNKKITISFIKKNKKAKYNEKLLSLLSHYYSISSKEVTQYLDSLEQAEVKDILTRFGIDDKDIKKLLK